MGIVAYGRVFSARYPALEPTFNVLDARMPEQEVPEGRPWFRQQLKSNLGEVMRAPHVGCPLRYVGLHDTTAEI
jgi:hypothetical protein